MRSQTNLKQPPRFSLASHDGNHLVLSAQANCRIELFVLAEDIIRVLVLPDGEIHGPRSWAIAPGADDVALEGRDRRDMSGFTPPPFAVSGDAGHVVVDPEGPECPCGGRGCAEAMVSESTIVRNAQSGVTLREVMQTARQGDGRAVAELAAAGRAALRSRGDRRPYGSRIL